KCTLSTSYIRRNKDFISYGKIVHLISEFAHYPNKFMPECTAHTCVRHHSMIEMEIRTAYTGLGYLHNSISWMKYFRDRLLFDTYAIRASVVHCLHNSFDFNCS